MNCIRCDKPIDGCSCYLGTRGPLCVDCYVLENNSRAMLREPWSWLPSLWVAIRGTWK